MDITITSHYVKRNTTKNYSDVIVRCKRLGDSNWEENIPAKQSETDPWSVGRLGGTNNIVLTVEETHPDLPPQARGRKRYGSITVSVGDNLLIDNQSNPGPVVLIQGTYDPGGPDDNKCEATIRITPIGLSTWRKPTDVNVTIGPH